MENNRKTCSFYFPLHESIVVVGLRWDGQREFVWGNQFYWIYIAGHQSIRLKRDIIVPRYG